MHINANERIEPLDETHSIIQSVDGYRFGTDAVMLAKYASSHIRGTDNVFELCSGCGVIGILVAIATGCTVTGAEIDEELWDMSVRSCALNGLSNVTFHRADVTAFGGKPYAPSAAFDAVICNPPFFKAESKQRNIAPAANSEITITLGGVLTAAKRLLKVGGALYMVYTSTRLDEALSACREIGLMPKELTVVHSGKTFLLRAVRGGKSGLTVTVKGEEE